jgi:hypothetical protein
MSEKINIFDKEVEIHLLKAGVSEQIIKDMKYKALKEKAIAILSKITTSLIHDDFDDIENNLGFSSSYGGGEENYFINFNGIISICDMDIKEVCDLLKSWKTESI